MLVQYTAMTAVIKADELQSKQDQHISSKGIAS